MSWRLVQFWRRLARQWERAGDSTALWKPSTGESIDCRARADVYRQCAKSLQRSIEIAERKARKGAA